MMYFFYKGFLILSVLFGTGVCDNRRPFYVIGHMINDLEDIRRFIDKGANAIESDVQFYRNGSVKELYHGPQCDHSRNCTHRGNLKAFFQHMSYITDPSTPGNYGDRLLLQVLDLKPDGSSNKSYSGRDVARHVLDYLWSKDGCRRPEIRVLVIIDNTRNDDIIRGFINEFKDRGMQMRLKDVGFSCNQDGSQDLEEVGDMFDRLGIRSHIWHGDGQMNYQDPKFSNRRLRMAVRKRDKDGSFQKVYQWTIDTKSHMRMSLNIGLDAIITNDPKSLVEVLQEPRYKDTFRMATREDNPFVRYFKKSGNNN